MDDFLHNLRSGKLKHTDRSGRSYNDPQYKGGPRKNVMDRRKRELETFERLNAVKEVLETISETQKRMVEATEARTKAEERKARAMEILAQNMYRMLNPNAKNVDTLFSHQSEIEPTSAIPPTDQTVTVESTAEPTAEPTVESSAKEVQDENAPDVESKSAGRLSRNDRDILIDMIGQMRADGQSWEKIARHIASKGYPTVSGRGSWRGITAKNLFDKAAIN
jgi:hypothetical protein